MDTDGNNNSNHDGKEPGGPASTSILRGSRDGSSGLPTKSARSWKQRKMGGRQARKEGDELPQGSQPSSALDGNTQKASGRTVRPRAREAKAEIFNGNAPLINSPSSTADQQQQAASLVGSAVSQAKVMRGRARKRQGKEDRSNKGRDTNDPLTGVDSSERGLEELEGALVPGAFFVAGMDAEEIQNSLDYDPSSFRDYSEGDGSGYAALNTAIEVQKENDGIMIIKDEERQRIEQQAQEDAEARILSTIAHAEIDMQDEDKRGKRRLYFLSGCVLCAIIIGVAVGVPLVVAGAGSSGNGKLSTPPPVPTLSPTPRVTSGEADRTCFSSKDITNASGITISGSTIGAERSLVGACGMVRENGFGVWYSVSGNGRVKTASTCNNTLFDTQISIFTDECDRLQCVAGNDQMKNCGNGDQSQLAWVAEENETYYILVHGYRRSAGTFKLLVDDLVDNDRCEDAVKVEEEMFGSTLGATLDDNIAGIDCGFGEQTAPGVWYSFVGQGLSARAYTETNDSTLFRPVVSVYQGDDCGNLKCVVTDDSGFASWDADFDAVYHILVHGRDGDQGDFRFNAETIVPPPVASPSPPPPTDACLFILLPGNSGCGEFVGIPLGLGSCGRDVFIESTNWLVVTVGNGSILRATVCEDSGLVDTQISVFRGNWTSLECVTGNDQYSACGDGSSVTWYGSMGEVYYVFVHDFGRDPILPFVKIDDEASLGVSLTPTSSTCEGAFKLSVDQESVVGSFVNASSQTNTCRAGDGSQVNIEDLPGVWYSVEQGTGRHMTVSACDGASTTQLRLLVFSGADCDELECIETVTTQCGLQESVTWLSELDKQYFVFVQQQSQQDGNPTDPVIGSEQIDIRSVDLGSYYDGVPASLGNNPSRILPNGYFVLFTGNASINDECDSPIGLLTPNGAETRGSLWSATIDSNTPACSGSVDQPVGRGVWFSVLGTGTEMMASLCSLPGLIDLYVSIYVGSCSAGLSCVSDQASSACDDGTEGPGGFVSWESKEGELYRVLVYGDGPVETSNFALSIFRAPPPPPPTMPSVTSPPTTPSSPLPPSPPTTPTAPATPTTPAAR